MYRKQTILHEVFFERLIQTILSERKKNRKNYQRILFWFLANNTELCFRGLTFFGSESTNLPTREAWIYEHTRTITKKPG